MDRRISGGVVVVLVALVVLTNSVNAQIYQCWGGCYNECFLRSSKPRAEKLACYFQCFNSCFPRSPSDYQYYCQIGCSLAECTPIPYTDGARKEKCLGRCTDRCKV